jgi:hypothetical protein
MRKRSFIGFKKKQNPLINKDFKTKPKGAESQKDGWV